MLRSWLMLHMLHVSACSGCGRIKGLRGNACRTRLCATPPGALSPTGVQVCAFLASQSLHAYDCRLPSLANYLIKTERELWGLLEGPWAGLEGSAHRRSWGQQVMILSARMLCRPVLTHPAACSAV